MGLKDWLGFGKKTPPASAAAPHSAARSADALYKEAQKAMAHLARVCYVPRVMAGPGNANSSHFCGNAALKPGEAWPACGYCKEPMELFVQLTDKGLPPHSGLPFGEGTLQVFYCVNDGCDGGPDSWNGFGQNQLTRVLARGTEVVEGARPPSCTFPTKVIVGWDAQTDYPNWEESETLGVKLDDPQSDAFYHHDDEVLPVTGEKLLGWPAWVQGVEYLDCPVCGERMKYIFQIDSERNIPYMFGDVGCGHASICLKHPDRGGFQWACC